ncbi:hypothetical protein HYV88_02755 [Candidatus Woesearchaeota archaeon]|nr:hypothetical protein [Candidatus Woesearchaeota archaeon]
MLNGRYQIRARPPSHGVKGNSPKEPKRKPKLYYLQDGRAYVLGVFPTSKTFVSYYVNQRKQQVTPSEDIEARTVRLDQQTLDRLTLLLDVAHNLTIAELSNNYHTFFYDVLNTIEDTAKWSVWKKEYGVKARV